MRIWKYPLQVVDTQVIEIPYQAQLLTVQSQGGEPQLWALVNEIFHKEPRKIAIYGTGNPIPDNPGCYIGTFQMHDGALVFHAFDVSGTL